MDKKQIYTAFFRYNQRKDEYLNDKIPSTIKEKYSNAFRFVDSESKLYVCEKNGKKGLVDKDGCELIPCLQDEIYEMIDSDGVIPFIRNNKWGLFHFGVCTDAIFDDVEINSEDYCRVMCSGQWGWIDSKGQFTTDETEAWFGSWCDADK